MLAGFELDRRVGIPVEGGFVLGRHHVLDRLALILVVGGRFRQLATAERILSDGGISFIGMTRAHTADPEVMAKALRGEADKVRRLGEEGARPHRVRYKALK